MKKRRAIISVSDKEGIVPFAKGLADLGFEIISTGGTRKTLDAAGIPTIGISDVTGFPEIMDGRVKLNGEVVNRTDTRVEIADDTVELDGKALVYSKYRYIMLNKPAGAVSATKDGLSRTVIDLLKDVRVRGLFPVGRLDKDTEGLLLLTDDGELSDWLPCRFWR